MCVCVCVCENGGDNFLESAGTTSGKRRRETNIGGE